MARARASSGVHPTPRSTLLQWPRPDLPLTTTTTIAAPTPALRRHHHRQRARPPRASSSDDSLDALEQAAAAIAAAAAAAAASTGKGSAAAAAAALAASAAAAAEPPASSEGHSFDASILGPGFSNRARISDQMFESLMALPMTDGLAELRSRADALSQWKVALQKGALPRADAVSWPREPFRSKFIAALSSLEMARFTRRYPAVLDTLLKQMLSLVHDFETKLLEAEAKRAQQGKDSKQQKRQQRQRQQPSSQQQSQPKPPPADQKGDGEQEEQSESQDGEGSRQDEEGDEQQEDMVQANGQGQGDAGGGGGGGGGDACPEPGGGRDEDEEEQEDQDEGITQEQLEQAMREAAEAAREGEPREQNQQNQSSREIRLSLESEQTERDAADAAAEAAAREVVDAFERKMSRVVERLEAAQAALGDLSDVLDAAGQGGEGGFDLSQGVWTRAAGGWRELDELRKKLENLRELRDLVRSLGRAGGKGPLRRAPEQLEGGVDDPDGVVRSPLQPEEVRGLARSGELSRMLPSEMALLAHGWPRKRAVGAGGGGDGGVEEAVAASGVAAGGQDDDAAWIRAREAKQRARDRERRERRKARDGDGNGNGNNNLNLGLDDEGSQTEQEEEYYLPGAHAARMLHRVRRAERALLSYERLGWLDGVPARATGRTEVRPAAELGPILLCLDTSGSMRGAREVVAKALALECLRGAHRQRRRCYLYAFSGPEQVQELELGVDGASLSRLLDFLAGSFNGGTDVDAPLQRSLERLERDEWKQADVLMVTDGEVAPPSEELLAALGRARAELGLEVHGLVVSSQRSEVMEKICTRVHTFRSWSAVGAESWQY
jgi:uncharacterized protein with von Willebrand factor type A (vWA) domain